MRLWQLGNDDVWEQYGPALNHRDTPPCGLIYASYHSS